MIDALRVASLALWAAVIWRLGPDAYRAFTKRVRRHDMLWALFVGLAVNRLLFVARSAALSHPVDAGIDLWSLVFLYVFAIALSLGVLRAHAWYRDDA